MSIFTMRVLFHHGPGSDDRVVVLFMILFHRPSIVDSKAIIITDAALDELT